MYTPLLTALRAFRDTHSLRMHMPGHKGELPMPEWSALAPLDFTELTPTGDLYGGEGALMEAQELWARRVGMDSCLFLTGGSTQGIHTALTLACPPGSALLVDRGSHRSVYHSMALLDLDPVYLPRPWLAEEGILGPVEPEMVDRMLSEHPEIKTVCITSPTYYGVLSDLQEISRVVHRHGARLVVDGAHGAHLPWLMDNPFPGVDLLVISAHKTLPAPGQTALLLARGFDQEELRRRGAIYGSSSPSYPMMAALDWVRGWMDEEGAKRYQDTVRRTAAVREAWNCLRPGALDLDPTRLVWKVNGGKEVQEALEAQGIYPEMSDVGHVVFILTAMDGGEAFQRLERGMAAAYLSTKQTPVVEKIPAPLPFPTRRLTLRQALFAPREKVVLAQAAGKTSAGQIAPYPPGIPVIAPGEEIGKNYLAYLEQIGYNITSEADVVRED